MKILNLLKIAIKALNNNKMRCFLTMLGIIIGVGSVITMLAIGQGSKDSIKAQISEMGSNMIMIQPGGDQRGGVRQSSDDMQSLTVSDYETVLSECDMLAAVSPTVNSNGQLINGNNNYPSSIYGITPDYMEIRKLSVKEGSMFSDQDVKQASKVCLLGKTVIDNLFPNGESPLGKVIRFNKIPMTVIGVLEEKGTNSMGMDQDDIVLAPYTTIMKRVLAIDYIQGLYASAVDEDQTEEAIDQITQILRTQHKLRDDQDDNFEIRSQQELSEMMNSTSDMMTILLACIAGISLLVGGIGIMNIMYVSVTERTREIGLRMSIGARGIDILSQFLIESIIISVTGGVFGIILGFVASWLVNVIASWPVSVESYSVVLSFVVCTATGVFFGWYPAKKAANLDPIEAIRYE
jgi:putative ABC transport system permease protein